MIVRREMSFMKKNVAYKTKKNGAYEIKYYSRKIWTTIRFREKKIWGKVKKIGYLEYKKKVYYK